jgi:hypothetical protein
MNERRNKVPCSTFIYTHSDSLYVEECPWTHWEMLDPYYTEIKSKDIFKDVYGIDPDDDAELEREGIFEPQSRDTAAKYAILGRFSKQGDVVIITLWNRKNDPLVPKFIKKFFETYPEYKNENVVLVSKVKGKYTFVQQPELISKAKDAPKQPSLDKFKDIDPNELFLHTMNFNTSSGSFIYTHNKKLYEFAGMKTHYDMMQTPEIFNDIWGEDGKGWYGIKASDKEDWTQKDVGDLAIMGRWGVMKGQNIISLWVKLTHPLVYSLLHTLFNKHPEFKESAILIGTDEKPQLIGKLAGKTATTVSAPVKDYQIGGQTITRDRITELVSMWHNQPWKREYVKSILCHPDMEKYPELIQLIPPGCTPTPPKKSWYQAMKQSFPIETTLNFKEWFENF